MTVQELMEAAKVAVMMQSDIDLIDNVLKSYTNKDLVSFTKFDTGQQYFPTPIFQDILLTGMQKVLERKKSELAAHVATLTANLTASQKPSVTVDTTVKRDAAGNIIA